MGVRQLSPEGVRAGCGGFSEVKDVSQDLVWTEKVELEGKNTLTSVEQKMARLVYPVDTKLQSLIEAFRTMELENGDFPDLTGISSDFS